MRKFSLFTRSWHHVAEKPNFYFFYFLFLPRRWPRKIISCLQKSSSCFCLCFCWCCCCCCWCWWWYCYYYYYYLNYKVNFLLINDIFLKLITKLKISHFFNFCIGFPRRCIFIFLYITLQPIYSSAFFICMLYLVGFGSYFSFFIFF